MRGVGLGFLGVRVGGWGGRLRRGGVGEEEGRG